MSKKTIMLGIIFLLISFFSPLFAADSRNLTVTASYCDGTQLLLHPYSFVTRGDGTTFNCYEVQTSVISGGYRYKFEDKDDNDYNDIVIDLWVTGNGTASPTAHIKYVSKDAGYLHWIHLAYSGMDQLVFKAEEAQPGDVFNIPLAERQCPDFDLSISPDSLLLTPGDSGTYSITLETLGGFDAPVTLSVSSLPTGVSAVFSNNPIAPASNQESTLQISTTSTLLPGTYNIMVTGAGGEIEHTATASLKVTCINFTADIEAATERGAAPLVVAFQALPRSEGTQYKYSWDFGDGGTSTIENPTHTYHTPGNFQVKLTVTDSCNVNQEATKKIWIKGFDGTISKSFSPNQALPGDTVTMTIRAVNTTRFDFKKILIRDPWPKHLEYKSDTATVNPKLTGGELRWEFPELQRDEILTFDVKLKVAENAPEGTIENIAYLSHQSQGEDKEIPSNTATLEIHNIDVTLKKTVDKNTAAPGDTLVYGIVLTNNSSLALEGIDLRDTLSSHLEFIDQQGPLVFTNQGDTLSWSGSLQAGQRADIQVRARISGDTFAGTHILNTAKIQAKDLPETTNSNTVSTVIASSPTPQTKLRFTKRAAVPQAQVGRVIRFTLTIANQSHSSLITPVIEDLLPQGFSYVAGSTLLKGQAFTDPAGKRKLRWQLPSIKPYETINLGYQLVIGSNARRGKNVNHATLRTQDNSGQNVFMEAQAFVNVSTSSFIFYSSVEGTVYLDRDDDDFYSMSDTPLQGIEVRLSTGQRTATDMIGRYTFEDLLPGEYALGVNHLTLPDKYRLASSFPKVTVLTDGLSDTQDFAVKFKREDDQKCARLEGRVFFDKNSNKAYDPEDLLLKEFKIKLDERELTIGKKGTFVFTNLKPGTHSLELQYESKKKTIKTELIKGNNRIDIPLRFTGITILIQSEK